MPSSLRAFEHGSPAVGALSVLRGNVCRDAGRWNEWDDDLQCVPKKHRKKNNNIFSLPKGDHEKSSKIFSFRIG